MRPLLTLTLAAASWMGPAQTCVANDSEGIQFFETKIRPVLALRCFACHSAHAPKLQGGLSLDTRAGVLKGGNSGAVVELGHPDRSVLLRAIRYEDKNLKMPPGKPLPAEVVADFETWIQAGAPMPADAAVITKANAKQTFWSFQVPKDPPAPAVKPAELVRNEIDAFVLAKLEEKGLQPSPEADRRTLIRRVSYDLTGLPPTADDADAFVASKAPDAYEKLVDRLLASPRYGERWGRHWLDVARYSDARNVGERFAFSYTYRDWVIRALNEDMPYDRFAKLQLAADQMPEAQRRDLAALGFLSLGREFPKSFPETVDDRIDTVGRGMIGLTVACARCHDHKYDPIPTKDYYSMYSIFSNVHEPKDLPLLNASLSRTALDQVWEPRLEKIRKIDQDYRERRNREMIAFFKTQIADYLIAVRDSRTLSNTEIEDVVRDRQLNLHLLGRWRGYLAGAEARKDPVFGLWLALAAIPDKEFAARWKQVAGAQTGANARVAEAFHNDPPPTLRQAAELYQKVLQATDDARVAEALEPVNVPVSEFDLIYTEGDGNNTGHFHERYDLTRALYAYAGAAPRAMAVEDVEHPKAAHVFVRGNPNNPGVETPPHFLSCLSKGEPVVFRNGSGRLELANAITSADNPLTARVIVNRVWLHHFGQGIVRTPSDFGLRGDPPSNPELLDYLALRFMREGWSLKKLHRIILLSATYRQASADNPEARKVDPENTLLWRMNRQRLDIESLRDSLLAVTGELDFKAGGPPYSLMAQPAIPRRTVYGFIERGKIPAFLSSFDFASPDAHAPLRYVTTVPQQALFFLNSSFVADRAAELANRTEGLGPRERIEQLYRRVFGRPASADEVALGERFIESPGADEPPAQPASAWQYGFGDGKTFTPFRYFVGDAWQNASMLPDPVAGSAHIRVNGGTPGDDLRHAAVLRWVSPVAGKIRIEGKLSHGQSAIPAGDGVHGRIVTSKDGEIASWVVNGTGADTNLLGLTVEKGETIDFIVDGRNDIENDAYTWAPKIHLADAEQQWDAAKDFRGPRAKPLSVWARYAQVLLQSNQFAFVD